jgi:hypothetical protein
VLWEVDQEGYGRAVYRVDAGGRAYSLVAFSHYLAPERRTDRVIAEAWDTSYVLYDGVPDAEELARLQANAPLQEAGRYRGSDLILSRANRSVRLFDEVVATLAQGREPARPVVDAVGYLMRTTAVYGNGKFGLADLDIIRDRPELRGPFQAEMLTVWLIRAFTVDLAEHCARVRNSNAAVFSPGLRRRIGVGNSTGLGMAPFLVRHPTLLHRWVLARETALARVRAITAAHDDCCAAFLAALERAADVAAGWRTDDEALAGQIVGLRSDLERLKERAGQLLPSAMPWDALYRFAEQALGMEAQEYLVALAIEPYGDMVDDLADAMAADEDELWGIDGGLPIANLIRLLDQYYAWAYDIDVTARSSNARFWYISEEKLEPRLGERGQEPGAELELPLAIARDVVELRRCLATAPSGDEAGAFVLKRPEFRSVMQRVFMAPHHPYAEIHDNLISSSMRPIDMLRCKLAFFGARQFDPRSDRWLRIALYRGAPFPHELSPSDNGANA